MLTLKSVKETMREVIRDIFTGVYAPFTGRILASIALLPMLFSLSLGSNSSALLSNIVDESAIYEPVTETEEVEVIDEIKEPDAGVAQTVVVDKKTEVVPVGIADHAPVTYDLAISGRGIFSSVVNITTFEIEVPGSVVGYYNNTGTTPLLVGHNPGVFSGLTGISSGEIIEFRGEKYQVYNTKTYNYDPGVSVNDSNNNRQIMLDSLYIGGQTGLNLMTCTGAYSNGAWNQRFVAFTRKI